MRSRSVLLLALVATMALLIAACETNGEDDEVVEGADDTVAETTDGAADDEVVEEADDTAAEGTGDEAAEAADDTADDASDDAVIEEADDSDDAEGDASDDEALEATDDSASEATDDAGTEESDDTTEVADDAGEEFALEDEEFEAVLAALGFDSAEDAEAPELDTETLTAETPAMTLQAAAYDNVYVGEITEELLVAVSLDSTYADQADAISAYVCDGDEVGFYVTGEIENGQATIELAENAQLEFTVNGDTISGAVTLNNEEVGSFDASEATGDAGLYVAQETIEGTDVAARWIVLEDGRQAGQMCIGIWARGVCIGIYVSRN